MRLGLGLVLYGVSIALKLTAGFGVDYWDVLQQGLSQRTGIEITVLGFGGVGRRWHGGLRGLHWCAVPVLHRQALGAGGGVGPARSPTGFERDFHAL
jgi:hypothetical protein